MKISKRHNIILILLILLISVRIFAGDSGEKNKVKELNLNDFRIYNSSDKYISLDMTREEVEKIFGKPLQIKINRNQYDNNNDEFEYVYNGLKIYSYRKENKINYIYVTNASYHSPRGITVGDFAGVVKEIYPIDKIFPSGSILAQYYTEDGTLRVFNIAFEVKENKITSIIMEVASDL